jgi:hypothetical protein
MIKLILILINFLTLPGCAQRHAAHLPEPGCAAKRRACFVVGAAHQVARDAVEEHDGEDTVAGDDGEEQAVHEGGRPGGLPAGEAGRRRCCSRRETSLLCLAQSKRPTTYLLFRPTSIRLRYQPWAAQKCPLYVHRSLPIGRKRVLLLDCPSLHLLL